MDAWNARPFVATAALLSGLALPVTGLLDHAAAGASTESGAGWTIAHVTLGAVFVGFCTWHIVLNRRALLRHLRAAGRSDDRGGVPLPSREVCAATALVGGVAVLVVTHALAQG